MRLGLFEVCEIYRLINPEDGECMQRIQKTLLEVTRGKHNLLPHESTKSPLPKEHTSLFLPTYDIK